MNLYSSVGWCALLFVVFVPACASFNNQNLSPSRVAQIRETISATNRGCSNITVAHEACDQWRKLLADPSDLDENILASCLVLHASCLVRTGRDDEAICQYSNALNLQHAMSKESYEEAILGRGRSLQRLLKYDEARQQFLVLGTQEGAVCAAATCALREGNIVEALEILQNFRQQSSNQPSSEVAAMLIAFEQPTDNSDTTSKFFAEEAKPAAATSLLYRWILFLQTKNYKHLSFTPFPGAERDFTYLDLAMMNISPFDDHNFIHLDDKVLLHKLLSARNELTHSFWPFGVVELSKNVPPNKNKIFETTGLWIQKRRSGYGSHGNRVITSEEAKKLAATLDGTTLLQQMVEPPLLVDGRKFSLRIYVICIGENAASVKRRPGVFIAKEGLLKVASEQLQSSNSNRDINMRVHMTNSGRESAMIQRNLDYLENEVFAANGWSFGDFWEKIKYAVRTTLHVYFEEAIDQCSPGPSSALSHLAIPKILGFDFVVDSDRNVWMVEVNRFPGLEARDESDRGVKEGVLQDTWKLAVASAGLSEVEIETIFGDLIQPTKDVSTKGSTCLEEIGW